MFGLGDSVSIVGLSLQLWKKYKDAQKWETRDKLVDNQWFTLAIEKGVLEADIDYSWSLLEKVETRLLQETHDIIYALDEEAQIKYRILLGDLVLLARREPK